MISFYHLLCGGEVVNYFTSNLGNSFGQARREGATLDQSMLYGVEQLASNVGIDLLTNGLPGLSEGLLPQSVSSALGGKRGVVNSLSEALGGSLSEWWTPYLKRTVYDPQAEKAGAGEIARAALNQLAMAGMMNLGTWGAEKLDNALDARQPRSYGTKGKPVEPAGLRENGMRAYQTAYRGNVDVEEYSQGFELLYKAGKDGVVTVEQALRAAPDAVAVLGENGARQAYFSGQNDGKAQTDITTGTPSEEGKGQIENWVENRNGDGIIGTNKMGKNTSDEVETQPGEVITEERLEGLKSKIEELGFKFAEGKELSCGGFENYRGSLEVLERIEKTLENIKKEYLPKTRVKDLVLKYADLGNMDDYAETMGKTVILNSRIWDDANELQNSYAQRAEEGWFVKGTTVEAIPMHELGHVIAKRHPDMQRKAYQFLQKKAVEEGMKLDRYLEIHLSKYATMKNHKDYYIEIISELYSAFSSTDISRKQLSEEFLENYYKGEI